MLREKQKLLWGTVLSRAYIIYDVTEKAKVEFRKDSITKTMISILIKKKKKDFMKHKERKEQHAKQKKKV